MEWTIERATQHDRAEQTVAGSDFPWYARANHPTMGLIRIPFGHILDAREFVAARTNPTPAKE